jgi:hypothetical protein
MRKRPKLLRSIYGLGEQSNRKMIGLIGTHSGVGVTHTGLLLAGFLGNVLGRKTALVEMNTHKDFERIEEAYYGKEEVTSRLFKINHVFYYKNAKQWETTDILNEYYEYIIFDFGSEMNKNQNEFLRCDKKIVISSLSDWKRNDLVQFIQNNQDRKGYSSWMYLFVFGQKRDLLDLRREVKVRARLIGYEPVPYILSNETIGLFHSVI